MVTPQFKQLRRSYGFDEVTPLLQKIYSQPISGSLIVETEHLLPKKAHLAFFHSQTTGKL